MGNTFQHSARKCESHARQRARLGDERGFTLIGALIIGLLATIAVPQFDDVRQGTKKALNDR